MAPNGGSQKDALVAPRVLDDGVLRIDIDGILVARLNEMHAMVAAEAVRNDEMYTASAARIAANATRSDKISAMFAASAARFDETSAMFAASDARIDALNVRLDAVRTNTTP